MRLGHSVRVAEQRYVQWKSINVEKHLTHLDDHLMELDGREGEEAKEA